MKITYNNGEKTCYITEIANGGIFEYENKIYMKIDESEDDSNSFRCMLLNEVYCVIDYFWCNTRVIPLKAELIVTKEYIE